MRTILTACIIVMSAIVTTPTSARAEDSHSPETRTRWAHTGWTARIGTSVGYSDIAKERWSTLGGQVAVGYRLGAIALEAEYERNKLLHYTGLGNDLSGGLKRFGASARYFAPRFGASRGGKSSFFLFVDASVGKQRGTLEGQSFQRSDYGGGMGILLDHLIDAPDVGMRRLGWQLGWRITGTPRASSAMARIVCISNTPCPPPSDPRSRVDVGLALGSSLTMSW